MSGQGVVGSLRDGTRPVQAEEHPRRSRGATHRRLCFVIYCSRQSRLHTPVGGAHASAGGEALAIDTERLGFLDKLRVLGAMTSWRIPIRRPTPAAVRRLHSRP